MGFSLNHGSLLGAPLLILAAVGCCLPGCGTEAGGSSISSAPGAGGNALTPPAPKPPAVGMTTGNGGTTVDPPVPPVAQGGMPPASGGSAGTPPVGNTGGIPAAAGGMPAATGGVVGAGGAEPGVQGSGPYVEKDGLVVIEVENTPPTAGWVLKTEHAGFTGSGYYEWTAGMAGQAANPIKIPVRIATPGEYQVHVYSHQGAGAIWDMANDLFLRVPNTVAVAGYADLNEFHKTYVGSAMDHTLPDRNARMAARSALVGDWRFWIWTEEPRRVPRAMFAAGLYDIELAGRSGGFGIDRVVVALAPAGEQPDAALSAAWTKLAESKREP